MPAELAQELGGGERALVAGERGPEGLHERRRSGARDAEELLKIAAGEEVLVQRLELADGVGDGEEPAGRGGHRRYAAIPRWALRMGGWTAGIFCVMLGDDRPKHQIHAGLAAGPIKGVMGR